MNRHPWDVIRYRTLFSGCETSAMRVRAAEANRAPNPAVGHISG
ncbi:MAG: hypothetical protein WB579_12425 [Bryobacteraceae bacterium]